MAEKESNMKEDEYKQELYTLKQDHMQQDLARIREIIAGIPGGILRFGNEAAAGLMDKVVSAARTLDVKLGAKLAQPASRLRAWKEQLERKRGYRP